MPRRACVLAFAVALLAGCGGEESPGGILDIDVDVPPERDGFLFAVLRVRIAGDAPRSGIRDDLPLVRHRLHPLDTSTFGRSVEHDDLADSVEVHVAFCANPDDCEEGPEEWFVLVRPFLADRHRLWHGRIDAIPDRPGPADVECAPACDDLECTEAEQMCDIRFVRSFEE